MNNGTRPTPQHARWGQRHARRPQAYGAPAGSRQQQSGLQNESTTKILESLAKAMHSIVTVAHYQKERILPAGIE